MKKLSVILTTFNEEEIIRKTLDSVQWADQIIVVDSYSTDSTMSILGEYPITVFQREYTSPADQKNWALTKAAHQWVLILDADEIVTPELRTEIKNYLAGEISSDAFWIHRDNYFMGKRIRFSGWQNDKVIRFLHRDKCRYDGKQVHEEIETDGIKVNKLKGRLLHYSYKNTDHFLQKLTRYARWSAQDKDEMTGRIHFYHLTIKPLARFLKHYIWQLGILDGRRGLIISSVMSYVVFLRYFFMIERRRDAN